jgi:asparagine synthase (glutamine-hydrolysing)
MCGIAGWYDPAPEAGGDRQQLLGMLELMAHRGPDDRGVYIQSPVRLGHNRLSIIDLEGGRQPMQDAAGRLTVIFNGEIYNFQELRSELEGRGYGFRTRSDTEVLLAAYETYGTRFIDRLNGMFAFALWDSNQSKLLLARDRLGIKPLFYTILPTDVVVFASEIKALLDFPGVKRVPNLQSISSYLSFRRSLGTDTFFSGIQSLAPGHMLTISGGRTTTGRYWSLPEDKYSSVSAELLFDKTEELFEASVKRRMISDVPFGAFLSGGLDSSAVVAMMAGVTGDPVKTYSVGFPEEGYNELEHARAVAKLFHTEHHEKIMGEDDYFDLISKLILFKDEPLSVANEVALYELSRFLKERITVVLSGEGADELFAGYGRIFRSPFDYQRLLDRPVDGGYADPRYRDAVMARYGRTSFDDETDFFLSLYEYVGREQKEKLFTTDAWGAIGKDAFIRAHIETTFSSTPQLSLQDKYLRFFQQFHLENLLRRVDMTTMATSVEARVPFVDHELIEHVSRIPFGYKMPWKSDKDRALAQFLTSDSISETHDVPKFLLKTIMKKKLPETIINRKKMGFPVPLEHYCGGVFLDRAREILCSPDSTARGQFDTNALGFEFDRIRQNPSHKSALQMWMLLNVELWFRHYIDGSGAKTARPEPSSETELNLSQPIGVQK